MQEGKRQGSSAKNQAPAADEMPGFIRWLERRPTLLLLLVLFVLQTAIHFRYLNYPPGSFHQFRQTQTLSVARNFYEESGSIFKPRVDNREQYTGITGMEFPLVNYTIALGYRIFGFGNAVSRVTLLLFSFIGLWGCFLFAQRFFRSKAIGFLAAAMLLFSPLFVYYSITALPDIPAMSFMFLSLGLWVSYRENNSWWYLSLCMVSLLIAGLVKITCLIAFAYYFYDMLRGSRAADWKRPNSLIALAGMAIVTGLVGGWYLYARHLDIEYHVNAFRLGSSFSTDPTVIYNALKRTFVQWLPELYINYAQFVLFCIGWYALIVGREVKERVFVTAFVVALGAYYVAELSAFRVHNYYMIPALPLLIFLVTLGLRFMLRRWNTHRWVSLLTILLLVAIPILGCARALPRFARIDRADDLYHIEAGLQGVIPMNALIVAASDESPSIYLYAMHRKGWSIRDNIPAETFREIIVHGARYLVSDSRKLEDRPEIRQYLTPIASSGRFNIYSLAIPPSDAP
ncbi:MAG TPA: glycosyltransferase family 39 protein [candidate division Zixibacteria bacterium]|nr:glycosyltransferase family 39 protein [candidate division Zixibacteria bacterium]